jgi:hypothetical protein
MIDLYIKFCEELKRSTEQKELYERKKDQIKYGTGRTSYLFQ